MAGSDFWNFRVIDPDETWGRRDLVLTVNLDVAKAAFDILAEQGRHNRLALLHGTRVMTSTDPQAAGLMRSPEIEPAAEKAGSMLARYAVAMTVVGLQQTFRTEGQLPAFRPKFNAGIGQFLPVVRRRPDTGRRSLDLLRWGLVPPNDPDSGKGGRHALARFEGAGAAPQFAASVRSKRCLVPCTHLFEKAPATGRYHAIARADNVPMAIAGLWEGWRTPDGKILRTFAVLTMPSADDMTRIHARMPALLTPASWGRWLGEDPDGDADPLALIEPYPDHFIAWNVGPEVESLKNDRQEVLAPLRDL